MGGKKGVLPPILIIGGRVSGLPPGVYAYELYRVLNDMEERHVAEMDEQSKYTQTMRNRNSICCWLSRSFDSATRSYRLQTSRQADKHT